MASAATSSEPDGVASSAGGAAARAVDPALVRQARKDVARIERQLSRVAEREEKLHGAMAEQAADHTKLLALDADLRALHAERAALEEEWLAAAEILE